MKNRELQAFTHTVSHDLRQPLNGVIGFAELLLSEKPGTLNPTQKEYLGDIYTGGHQLLRLISDLLEFSRLGHQPLRREPLDMTDLVRDIATAMRAAEADRRMDLRRPTPRRPGRPVTNRAGVVNLLSNAFKFTRLVPEARIEVTGEQGDSELTYRVLDNGAGFDMANAHDCSRSFKDSTAIETSKEPGSASRLSNASSSATEARYPRRRQSARARRSRSHCLPQEKQKKPALRRDPLQVAFAPTTCHA